MALRSANAPFGHSAANNRFGADSSPQTNKPPTSPAFANGFSDAYNCRPNNGRPLSVFEPSFRELYPEGRDRLLALAQQTTAVKQPSSARKLLQLPTGAKQLLGNISFSHPKTASSLTSHSSGSSGSSGAPGARPNPIISHVTQSPRGGSPASSNRMSNHGNNDQPKGNANLLTHHNNLAYPRNCVIPEKLMETTNHHASVSSNAANPLINGLKALGGSGANRSPPGSSKRSQQSRASNGSLYENAVIRDVGAGFSFWTPTSTSSKKTGVAPILTTPNPGYSRSTERLNAAQPAEKLANNNRAAVYEYSAKPRANRGRAGLANQRYAVKSEHLDLEQLRKLYSSMPDCSGGEQEIGLLVYNGSHDGQPECALLTPPPLPLSEVPHHDRNERASLSDDSTYANIEELQSSKPGMYTRRTNNRQLSTDSLMANGNDASLRNGASPRVKSQILFASSSPLTSSVANGGVLSNDLLPLDTRRNGNGCCSPSADSGYRSVPRSLEDCEASNSHQQSAKEKSRIVTSKSMHITSVSTDPYVNGFMHQNGSPTKLPPPYQHRTPSAAKGSPSTFHPVSSSGTSSYLDDEQDMSHDVTVYSNATCLNDLNGRGETNRLSATPSSSSSSAASKYKRRGIVEAKPPVSTPRVTAAALPTSNGAFSNLAKSANSSRPPHFCDERPGPVLFSSATTNIIVNNSANNSMLEQEMQQASGSHSSYCSELSSPAQSSNYSSVAGSSSTHNKNDEACEGNGIANTPKNPALSRLSKQPLKESVQPASAEEIAQETQGSHEGKESRAKSTPAPLNGSFDTINTNISLPDEHSLERCPKLVELEKLPWNEKDVVTVLQRGRSKDLVNQIAIDVVPRLTYLLQRPLIRIAMQRLSMKYGKCTKHDAQYATKIILPATLAENCIKAGLGASAMYMACCENLRVSKSHSAGVRLSVGKFMRWLRDTQISACVHEHAAVFLTAVMEYLLEEIVIQNMPPSTASSANSSVAAADNMLTSESLDLALSSNVELWGLLQPYQHLVACRTANGMLSLPNSLTSVAPAHQQPPMHCGSKGSRKNEKLKTNGSIVKNLEQSLLATCVGGLSELGELIGRVIHNQLKAMSAQSQSGSQQANKQPLPWSRDALSTLFYYMKCNQMEHGENVMSSVPCLSLGHERPYTVLPPLVEWMRIAGAFCEHRHGSVIDSDDINQAARVHLPSVDCPPRRISLEDPPISNGRLSPQSCTNRLKQDLALQMLSSGRSDMIPQALGLLGPAKLNSFTENGLTPLMLACIRGDEGAICVLLDSGANIDLSVPQAATAYCGAPIMDLGGWTALTFAVVNRHFSLVQCLLERGALVESQDMCTETPLQIAAIMGSHELVNLLLARGADPYLSTRSQDTSNFKRRGCSAAIVLAAANGHRTAVQMMLAKRRSGKSTEEVVSLADFLAESSSKPKPASPESSDSDRDGGGANSAQLAILKKLNKAQLRTLQEAMFHAAESGHIDITMDLRNLGIQWNTHIWTQTLAAAQELRRKALIQLLLSDFIESKLDDYSQEFIDDCLPLLFEIFRHTKNEITSRQLAEMLSNLYGSEPIPKIVSPDSKNAPRIDAKYVNNPDMSDVQFTLDGQIFYGHKIVLVNASEQFQEMLKAYGESSDKRPIAIEGIKYETFHTAMEFLYNGKLKENSQNLSQLIELLYAAHRYSLDGLRLYCQAALSRVTDMQNCIAIYKAAMESDAKELQQHCECFFLQHLPALMKSGSETFRKMIYASKSKGKSYDVICGLLNTLSLRLQANIHRK